MTSFLLDTHILVWWLAGFGRLSKAQSRFFEQEQRGPLALSAISLRELAMIGQRRRIRIDFR